MAIRLLFLLVFAFTEFFSFCQIPDTNSASFGQPKGTRIEVTKEIVQNLIIRSIDQPLKDKVSFPSNPWTASNDDSSFFKRDTIIFYTRTYYCPTNLSCCELIRWTFYNPEFLITSYDPCHKSIPDYSPKDNFKITLSEKNNEVFLKTFNQSKVVDNFKVIEMEMFKENHIYNSFKIVLVRQR